MVIWPVGTENILFTEKPEIVPFSFGFDRIDQGKFAQLSCVVSSGDMPITISWSLKGDIISSDPTMTTTMLGRQASILMIQSVDYQHSGTYTCRAQNPAGVTTYSAELKVNGKSTGGYWIIFYLQKSQRLFPLTLVVSQWMRESRWWSCATSGGETSPMSLHGIWKGT